MSYFYDDYGMSEEERRQREQEEAERKKRVRRRLTGGVVLAIILMTTLVLGTMCIEKIPRGHVGSIYSISGGTSDEVLSEGWHLVAPTKKVTEYSVATEQLLLTQDERKGSETDESFNATCRDGVLNVDLEMSYHFEAEDIPTIARKYRGKSGDDIVDSIIKSKVKTYVNEVTSEYTILEAYMDKKSELNKELTEHLKEALKPYGIVVESATIPRAEPDAAIKSAITERSKKAQEVEAAKQEQEKQKILAETKIIEAKGEAEAAIAAAKGEAEANRLISESLTSELLKQMEMEARLEHGWVTIQGAGNTIVDAKN